jgi:hypothetical protein
LLSRVCCYFYISTVLLCCCIFFIHSLMYHTVLYSFIQCLFLDCSRIKYERKFQIPTSSANNHHSFQTTNASPKRMTCCCRICTGPVKKYVRVVQVAVRIVVSSCM